MPSLTGEAGISYLRVVGPQDRVARGLGETPTDGFVTADLRAGITLLQGLALRAGVWNLSNAQYVNHLNAKNPYSGAQVPEPGRRVFANLTYAF